MQRSALLLAISLAGGSLSLCLGQTYTSNLTGLVTDPAGAVVPGVTLKLENVATHEKRETKTGEEGRFTFSQLLPGIYQLQTEAAGFKPFQQNKINLKVWEKSPARCKLVGSETPACRNRALEIETTSITRSANI